MKLLSTPVVGHPLALEEGKLRSEQVEAWKEQVEVWRWEGKNNWGGLDRG